MTHEDQIMKRHKARLTLLEHGRLQDRRDQDMRDARAAGIPVTEIAALVRLSRGHTSRIVNA